MLDQALTSRNGARMLAAGPRSNLVNPSPAKALRAAPSGGDSAADAEQMIGSDRDQFLDAVRRVAAKDRDGFADPEEVAIELGIGLGEVTELVRRYQGYFEWNSIPIGKLNLRS